MTELIDVNLYRKEIISLWQQCFSDKEEYIAFFLDNCAEFSCLGYRLDGKLVSMLFLLDSEIDGFKCSYLYAACTDGAHRGKGIMGRLIEFAKQVSISSGCSGIFLVPAEESLYGYYSRFNFESCFTKKSFSFELNRCEKYGDRVPDETDVKKIFDMRRELLSSLCRFSLSEKNSYYAIKEHFFNDGKIKYINSNGLKLLAFYYFDGKNILIKELLSNKSVEKLTIDELFINYNPENVYIFCPIVYNIMDNLAEYTKCGMCCPLNDEFKVYINSNSDFYAGIYLD